MHSLGVYEHVIDFGLYAKSQIKFNQKVQFQTCHLVFQILFTSVLSLHVSDITQQ